MDETPVTEVIWLPNATLSFDNIVNYLHQEWSDKEIEKFVGRVNEVLDQLKKNPERGQLSSKYKNVRFFILNKHTKMVYHYKPRKKQIEIMLFWNMKRDPAKFKY